MSFERIAQERHDTLEGIPEPAENPRLFGHAAAASALAAAYRAGKMPHGLLLSGPRGIGKATFAFHLAHHLLRYPRHAEAPETFAAPDIASSLWRQIAIGAHPGVLHLSRPYDDKGKRFRTALTVEEIRKVNAFLSLTSHDGAYRVVIVDPADDMNVSAANALLKNLEEPPARTVFILVTHALGGLLPTIRSRCQVVRLQPLDNADLIAALEPVAGQLPADERARLLLAERAAGSPREAILLLSHGGLEIEATIDRLARADRPDVAETHRLADALAGREQAIAFDLFGRHVLDLLSGEAARLAIEGDLGAAERLSGVWQEVSRATAEAETFNLDRKQHVLSTVARLNEAMRM